MIILRTQGCGVLCSFCDSKQTWALADDAFTVDWDDAMSHPAKWVDRDEQWIALALREKFPSSISWVLLTGGEPAEQPLAPLVRSLHDVGYSVALETSGTAMGHLGARIDWVCVSPKVNMPGGLKVLPAAIASADELKFVIGRESDLLIIEEILQWPTARDVTISLQPISQSQRATAICVEACLKRGWRLSLQLHKYINQP